MRSTSSRDFRKILHAAGYKATPSRIKVLSVLEKQGRPLSPHGVINKIGKTIDQATIYRILKAFKHAGIIRQVDFRHNHPHYELADLVDHHHLICTACGLSEEILGCEVDSMRRTVLRRARHFGEIREHSLEFYGLCTACANTIS